MSDRDWSDLPPDLVGSISLHLTLFSDYIRLRSLCRHFLSALPSTPRHLPPQLPWLMLPPSSAADRHRRGFYNIVNSKVHFMNLPEARGPRRVCCSSLGWLVVMDETPEIWCLNPLTRSKVYLPPLSSFPGVIDFSYYNVGREYVVTNSMGYVYSRNLKQMRDSYVKKVVLSASPGEGEDYVALAIMNYTGEMVYCEGRDGSSWRSIGGALHFSCEDVIYDEELFFGVDKGGRITIVDVKNQTTGPVVRVKDIETPVSFGGDMVYLVKLKDDLLMVSRWLDIQCEVDGYFVHSTTRFDIHKLDWSVLRWEVVSELGNYALFLGQNSSLLFSASDFGGCRGNCVYFTDDHSENTSDNVWRYHDMGIFNLKDHTIEPLPCYSENSECTHMWITPNPC